MSNVTNTTFSLYNYTLSVKDSVVDTVTTAATTAASYVPESISQSLDEVATVAAAAFGGHLVGTTLTRAYNGNYSEAAKSGLGACVWIAAGTGLSHQFETNPAWMATITLATASLKLTTDYQNGHIAFTAKKVPEIS